jgi:tRNA threonylcarbamoyl adenosine modification protein YeaZ
MNKYILSIETTTNICSVSLYNNTELIILKEDINRKHSSLLGKFVDDIFNESDLDIKHLDAIAISIGPGSYTGLRIGLSFAKGMAYALNKPIIPIDTMDSINDSINDSNYFIILPAYKNYYYIQEYRDSIKSNEILLDTIDSIKNGSSIYGYSENKLEKDITYIPPSSKNISNIAYKYFNNYICHNIKSIKPKYIKPIQFKENNS